MTIRPIHIGTSGFHYRHWVGPFYPEDLRAEEWLPYYAERFTSLEVNNSFYRLPAKSTVKKWLDAVPSDFIFTVKANRFITHMKKLKDPKASNARFLDWVKCFGKQLGPILFQLPPHWSCNATRLTEFLAALPRGLDYAFEFRDESWMTDKVYGMLRDHNAAFCIYELNGYQSPCISTADFVYVRLHGPGAAYVGRYGKARLTAWKDKVASWRKGSKRVYWYFDNDDRGYAAQDALCLREILSA